MLSKLIRSQIDESSVRKGSSWSTSLSYLSTTFVSLKNFVAASLKSSSQNICSLQPKQFHCNGWTKQPTRFPLKTATQKNLEHFPIIWNNEDEIRLNRFDRFVRVFLLWSIFSELFNRNSGRISQENSPKTILQQWPIFPRKQPKDYATIGLIRWNSPKHANNAIKFRNWIWVRVKFQNSLSWWSNHAFLPEQRK